MSLQHVQACQVQPLQHSLPESSNMASDQPQNPGVVGLSVPNPGRATGQATEHSGEDDQRLLAK